MNRRRCRLDRGSAGSARGLLERRRLSHRQLLGPISVLHRRPILHRRALRPWKLVLVKMLRQLLRLPRWLLLLQ